MDEKNNDSVGGEMEDDLLRKLLPDLNNPDVNVLTGFFIGRGTDDKSIRVYTNMRLTQYFQIPKEKVLGAKRFPSGQLVVWIPGDLKVQLITSTALSGDFLKGGIQSGNARRGAGGLGSAVARLNQQQGPDNASVFGGPFCNTDIPDPNNPICGLTNAGCPPGPGC